MHKRIEEVRKYNKLTRAAFGERIGVSGDVINNLERGRVEIKDHIIRLICMEYDINEDWLRTGEGEMFIPETRDDEIAKFTTALLKEESDSFKNRLISTLAKMTEEEWEMLERKMREILGE